MGGGGANGGTPSYAPTQGKVGGETKTFFARLGSWAHGFSGLAPLSGSLVCFDARGLPWQWYGSTAAWIFLRFCSGTCTLGSWLLWMVAWSTIIRLASRAFILALTTLATRGSLVFMLYAAHDYLWECWLLTGHNTFRSSLRKFGPGARRRTEQYYGHVYLYWCCVRGGGRRALQVIFVTWYPDTQLAVCVSIGATPDPTILSGSPGQYL